ncbi:MAG: bacteriochlorophyll 4-vinyl reductase [Sandaracinaceae bacterium]
MRPHAQSEPGPARIGPNAVAQTLHALERREGRGLADEVRARCELPPQLPDALVPETWFVDLVEALRAQLPPGQAEATLQEGGARTASYVAARRIPTPVRVALRWMPRRVALPLLLRAFAEHAWTFAGAGEFAVDGPYPGTITLRNAPTCRRPGAPGGAYYAAAFEGLLQIAAPGARVREIACQAQGADRCRFVIDLGADRAAS